MENFDLKKFRKQHKLGRVEFSEKLGISIHTLDSWELGKRNIPNSKIKLITEIFKEGITEENYQKKDLHNNHVDSLKKQIINLNQQIEFLKNENTFLKENILKLLSELDENIKEIQQHNYLNDKLEYAKNAVKKNINKKEVKKNDS